MTGQPATQTCGECRVVQSLTCYERTQNWVKHRSHKPDCWIVEPCPLHAQAEETAKERDALLEALEASDKDASALVEIINQLPKPKDEADYEYIAETMSKSSRIHQASRAALAAATPSTEHAAQKDGAG